MAAGSLDVAGPEHSQASVAVPASGRSSISPIPPRVHEARGTCWPCLPCTTGQCARALSCPCDQCPEWATCAQACSVAVRPGSRIPDPGIAGASAGPACVSRWGYLGQPQVVQGQVLGQLGVEACLGTLPRRVAEAVAGRRPRRRSKPAPVANFGFWRTGSGLHRNSSGQASTALAPRTHGCTVSGKAVPRLLSQQLMRSQSCALQGLHPLCFRCPTERLLAGARQTGPGGVQCTCS